MKQEEDMMRYLYEYAPENDFLVEHQDKILLDVFNEVPTECLVTKKLTGAPVIILLTIYIELLNLFPNNCELIQYKCSVFGSAFRKFCWF